MSPTTYIAGSLRRILRRAGIPSVRTQEQAKTLLLLGIALMGFVSLHPYLLWSHQKPFYGIATLIILASLAVSAPSLVFSRERLLLSIAFSLFLIYLSLLPKVSGGTTRWFFLIPFVVAVVHLRREDLEAAFVQFHWIFVASLLPGMLLWLWIVVGFPVELRYMTPPADIIQRGVTEYGELPGAIFLISNGVVLPHGGVLFRLCGMYDEPGTVGTVAALCLAATRFRLGNIRGGMSFLAGIMSFSLAFAVLLAVGLILTALSKRRLYLLPLAGLCVIAAYLPLSGFRLTQPPPSNVTILTSSLSDAKSMPGGSSALRVDGDYRFRFVPAPEWALRNAPEFDNRAYPRMRALLDEYLRVPVTSKLFGIASDASIIYGWGSSVWYRLLTDYGIVGFLWAFGLFSFPIVHVWRLRGLEAGLLIFCTLYLMSFYQRPIIWLPAQLLIYFAGIYADRGLDKQESGANPGRSRNGKG